eukprot:jgi/Botrbrau1/23079/Bobra.0243s0020.1
MGMSGSRTPSRRSFDSESNASYYRSRRSFESESAARRTRNSMDSNISGFAGSTASMPYRSSTSFDQGSVHQAPWVPPIHRAPVVINPDIARQSFESAAPRVIPVSQEPKGGPPGPNPLQAASTGTCRTPPLSGLGTLPNAAPNGQHHPSAVQRLRAARGMADATPSPPARAGSPTGQGGGSPVHDRPCGSLTSSSVGALSAVGNPGPQQAGPPGYGNMGPAAAGMAPAPTDPCRLGGDHAAMAEQDPLLRVIDSHCTDIWSSFSMGLPESIPEEHPVDVAASVDLRRTSLCKEEQMSQEENPKAVPSPAPLGSPASNGLADCQGLALQSRSVSLSGVTRQALVQALFGSGNLTTMGLGKPRKLDTHRSADISTECAGSGPRFSLVDSPTMSPCGPGQAGPLAQSVPCERSPGLVDVWADGREIAKKVVVPIVLIAQAGPPVVSLGYDERMSSLQCPVSVFNCWSANPPPAQAGDHLEGASTVGPLDARHGPAPVTTTGAAAIPNRVWVSPVPVPESVFSSSFSEEADTAPQAGDLGGPGAAAGDQQGGQEGPDQAHALDSEPAESEVSCTVDGGGLSLAGERASRSAPSQGAGEDPPPPSGSERTAPSCCQGAPAEEQLEDVAEESASVPASSGAQAPAEQLEASLTGQAAMDGISAATGPIVGQRPVVAENDANADAGEGARPWDGDAGRKLHYAAGVSFLGPSVFAGSTTSSDDGGESGPVPESSADTGSRTESVSLSGSQSPLQIPIGEEDAVQFATVPLLSDTLFPEGSMEGDGDGLQQYALPLEDAELAGPGQQQAASDEEEAPLGTSVSALAAEGEGPTVVLAAAASGGEGETAAVASGADTTSSSAGGGDSSLRPASAGSNASGEVVSPFAYAPPPVETPPHLSPQNTWERASLLTLATVPEQDGDDDPSQTWSGLMFPSQAVQDPFHVDADGGDEGLCVLRAFSTPAEHIPLDNSEAESPRWCWMAANSGSPALAGLRIPDAAGLGGAAPLTPKESSHASSLGAASSHVGRRPAGYSRVASTSSLNRSSSVDSRCSMASTCSSDAPRRLLGRFPTRVHSHSNLRVMPRHKAGVTHSASYSGLDSLLPLSPSPGSWSRDIVRDGLPLSRPFELLLHGTPPPGDPGGPLGVYEPDLFAVEVEDGLKFSCGAPSGGVALAPVAEGDRDGRNSSRGTSFDTVQHLDGPGVFSAAERLAHRLRQLEDKFAQEPDKDLAQESSDGDDSTPFFTPRSSYDFGTEGGGFDAWAIGRSSEEDYNSAEDLLAYPISDDDMDNPPPLLMSEASLPRAFEAQPVHASVTSMRSFFTGMDPERALLLSPRRPPTPRTASLGLPPRTSAEQVAPPSLRGQPSHPPAHPGTRPSRQRTASLDLQHLPGPADRSSEAKEFFIQQRRRAGVHSLDSSGILRDPNMHRRRLSPFLDGESFPGANNISGGFTEMTAPLEWERTTSDVLPLAHSGGVDLMGPLRSRHTSPSKLVLQSPRPSQAPSRISSATSLDQMAAGDGEPGGPLMGPFEVAPAGPLPVPMFAPSSRSASQVLLGRRVTWSGAGEAAAPEVKANVTWELCLHGLGGREGNCIIPKFTDPTADPARAEEGAHCSCQADVGSNGSEPVLAGRA